jgi:hypothetical protein
VNSKIPNLEIPNPKKISMIKYPNPKKLAAGTGASAEHFRAPGGARPRL